MDKMKAEEIVERENEIDIHGQEDEQIYPMDGIKVDKGFYSVFELKRRYDVLVQRFANNYPKSLACFTDCTG